MAIIRGYFKYGKLFGSFFKKLRLVGHLSGASWLNAQLLVGCDLKVMMSGSWDQALYQVPHSMWSLLNVLPLPLPLPTPICTCDLSKKIKNKIRIEASSHILKLKYIQGILGEKKSSQIWSTCVNCYCQFYIQWVICIWNIQRSLTTHL